MNLSENELKPNENSSGYHSLPILILLQAASTYSVMNLLIKNS